MSQFLTVIAEMYLVLVLLAGRNGPPILYPGDCEVVYRSSVERRYGRYEATLLEFLESAVSDGPTVKTDLRVLPAKLRQRMDGFRERDPHTAPPLPTLVPFWQSSFGNISTGYLLRHSSTIFVPWTDNAALCAEAPLPPDGGSSSKIDPIDFKRSAQLEPQSLYN
ncbi:hypothetical protein B0H11DRAFT_2232006 [Mycena galericulata]|nr:hypothetical protein B0H11DRAFT_2232006 [Mycena galericulata]